MRKTVNGIRCFTCNKPIYPGDNIYRLFGEWNYCSWLCVLMDCLEEHTMGEILSWNDEKRLDLYYTELEIDTEAEIEI